MQEANEKVCKACLNLAVDILSGSTRANDRWKTLQSEHTTLTYTLDHYDGRTEPLRASAENGCPSCHIIVQKLNEMTNSTPPVSYRLFVWGVAPPRCEFQVTTSDLAIFLKHVEYWKPLRALEYFSSSPVSTTLRTTRAIELAYQTPRLAHLPHQDPSSLEATHQASLWLQDCLEGHAACSRPKSILPKRVLDLENLDTELTLALYITKGEVEPYATLSYTWGEGDRLVTSIVKPEYEKPADGSELVIRQRMAVPQADNPRPRFDTVAYWSPSRIPLAAFPKTHQGALRVAKALGFRYIWIDSLCIIQGDGADWAEQGAAMTDIYGRSTLVISATSSENSNQGLFADLENKSVAVGTWEEGAPHDSTAVAVLLGEPLPTLDLEEKYISTRGWVFQERLVSTATLHYTDEGLVWECASGTRLAHDQNVSAVQWKADWRRIMHQDSPRALAPASPSTIWFDWVKAYSERDLFDSQDKLPALAGVARRFQAEFGSKYLAGLWADDLVAGLLWRRHASTETLVPLKDKYVAPSWSWASVRGRLEYRYTELVDSEMKGPGIRVDLENVSVEEEHAATFGRIKPGASLVAVGQMQRVTVDRHIHPGNRQRPHQECGIVKGFANPENVLCMPDEWAESAPRHLECWCLRIGSHDVSGRESDVFLLLENVAGQSHTFRRIGMMETDAWFDVRKPNPMSGILENPQLMEIKIV